MGAPLSNGWSIRDTPIKMDDWGSPYFRKHPYESMDFLYESMDIWIIGAVPPKIEDECSSIS